MHVYDRYLATASSDHTVKIWNAEGFTLEKTLVGNEMISLLHSGDYYKLQNTVSDQINILLFTGHQRWVWDCVFSVDGAFLITGIYDTESFIYFFFFGGKNHLF